MNNIGTMRCPIRAIVSMATGKPEILDEQHRCKGAGPVFEKEETKKHTLYIECSKCCKGANAPPLIAMNAEIWRGFVEDAA